jgi:hypothetical protein
MYTVDELSPSCRTKRTRVQRSIQVVVKNTIPPPTADSELKFDEFEYVCNFRDLRHGVVRQSVPSAIGSREPARLPL